MKIILPKQKGCLTGFDMYVNLNKRINDSKENLIKNINELKKELDDLKIKN